MPSLDFASYITSRTRDFTGREWVFSKIEEWLASPRGGNIFLITGRPGTGKSAVAARVVQMSLGEVDAAAHPLLGRDRLAYFHFCQSGFGDTISPLIFVQALSEKLANRYPAFREALEKSGSRQIIVDSVVNVGGEVKAGAQVTGVSVRIEIKGGDARPLFDLAVRLPLQELCRQIPSERIVILVDSLDEALTFNSDNNITQLLKLVNDFPPQVRFILTCRSNSEQVFDLVGRPTLDLIDNAPANSDEVKAFATARLSAVAEPARSAIAQRVADKSNGNFLYAFHVINDLVSRNGGIGEPESLDLPDELEGIYRQFIKRELASNPSRWSDVFRPILGSIAVARGEGLTKAQLVGITGLAEDIATDVLKTSAQYLVGGEAQSPYRIYHQSFRDFFLTDDTLSVFPAERHAAIANYLQQICGASWGTCSDPYALQYAPVHWAEAAALSAQQPRETRTQALIDLTGNPRYQRRFERQIQNLPTLHEHLHRAIQVAALNDRGEMLPWLIRAAQGYLAFRRDYLQPESVMKLAEEGRLDEAEARLSLFTDIDEGWQIAARLILAWLGADRNAAGAEQLRQEVAKTDITAEPLPLLMGRVEAALHHQTDFAFEPQDARPLEVSRELVKRVSGQGFNRELIESISPGTNISQMQAQSEMIGYRGYAAGSDAPILVNAARAHDEDETVASATSNEPGEHHPGTMLVDQYIDAHAGYNYVQYRIRSLWIVMQAVLLHHPKQIWVKERLRRILIATLSAGGVEFSEELPLTAALLRVPETGARAALDSWCAVALQSAGQLTTRRGADDSWGRHKRRLTALMELYRLVLGDAQQATVLFDRIRSLPGGFAGFQAPAYLRLADGMRACGMTAPPVFGAIIELALVSAHHIQDYHFCARVTARCNALKRWHETPLTGPELADTIRRFAASPFDGEFAACHLVHEAYAYRDHKDPDTLSIASAQSAETLDQLVEVFQRPAVEFRRLNPKYSLEQVLGDQTLIRVPDPGLAPLLAIHLAARVLADEDLEDERGALIRPLTPIAANNPTALDTLLSYLLIAMRPEAEKLLSDIEREAGPVSFTEVGPSAAQIGPDPVTPA